MKLFAKTFLYFTSVIVFESALIGLFVTDSIDSTNRDDARRELKDQAGVVFDGFNSWKRTIWKSLMELRGDEVLKQSLLEPGAPFADDEQAVTRRLQTLYEHTGFDVFLQSSGQGYQNVVSAEPALPPLSGFQDLADDRMDPHLVVRRIGPDLVIAGSLALPGRSKTMKISVVKRVDDQFCQTLSLNPAVHCTFTLDGRFVTGWAGPESNTRLAALFKPSKTVDEAYSWTVDTAGYDASVQRVPNFLGHDGEKVLSLVTFISNQPYKLRIQNIDRFVFIVSLVSAFLALFISLFLTKNITVPVRKLLHSMRQVQNGGHVQTHIPRSDNEISQLLTGFNEMATHLYQDKVTMDQFIREITFLNDYNAKIIESMRVGILIVDEAGLIQKANSAFLATFGLAENDLVGRPVNNLELDVVDASIAQEITAISQSEKDFVRVLRRTRFGRVFEVKVYPLRLSRVTSLRGCILVAEDMSETIELEQKIFQAEKLSSLSMLSAGVAHEINNPLSSIMTNVQNLLGDEVDPEKRVALGWIEKETRRIATIVESLLRFSAPDSDPHASCDVNAAIAEVLTLVGYTASQQVGVSFRQELKPNLPLANVGPNELRQILISLVNNSLQAMNGSGVLSITSRKDRGGLISIIVSDTGTGIPPEIIPHIFDPFFTTKDNGEGTGLGLSVAYGLLKKYRATLRVTSTVGRGTKMKIALLPATGAS